MNSESFRAKTLENLQDLYGVICFDNWVLNVDRNNVGNNLIETQSGNKQDTLSHGRFWSLFHWKYYIKQFFGLGRIKYRIGFFEWCFNSISLPFCQNSLKSVLSVQDVFV
jgi:hypothetical protein